jgi:hypothetical protein
MHVRRPSGCGAGGQPRVASDRLLLGGCHAVLLLLVDGRACLLL